jgi:hypothetical protein
MRRYGSSSGRLGPSTRACLTPVSMAAMIRWCVGAGTGGSGGQAEPWGIPCPGEGKCDYKAIPSVWQLALWSMLADLLRPITAQSAVIY